MTVAQVRSISLSAGAALLLTFLFIEQRPPDPRQHNRFTRDLLRIKQLDAEINRDLLSSRYELLNSYDPFVKKIGGMQKAESDLRRVPAFVSGPARSNIEQFLMRESAAVGEKARLVEIFKSNNAVLKNSLRYFPVLIAEVSRTAEQAGDAKLRDRLSNLLRDTLLYDLRPNRELVDVVDRDLQLLPFPHKAAIRPEFETIGTVRAHVSIILEFTPKVREITRMLASLPVAPLVDGISDVYIREYDRTLQVNAVYRLFLYLCSVVLAGYGADRTMNLVKSRGVLEKANRRLLKSNDQLLKAEMELKSTNKTIELTVDRLRTAQERYELAVRGANDGLWDWDLATGEIYFSPRWKEMLGFAPEELADSSEAWTGRLHPDDGGRVLQEWNDHLADRSPVFESEHRVRHRDGTYRWMLSRGMAVRAADGRAQRIAGSQTDITGNKCRDPLTGLPNRLLFSERLSQIIRETRLGRPAEFAVLFLDIDRFKTINDSLGHLAGDSLLCQIAERLKGCVRVTDAGCRLLGDSTVARLGGDEFAILIDKGCNAETAQLIADRVIAEFGRPFQIGGREIVSTLSVGVAVGNADYVTPEEILRDADIAMYEAKLSGKARAEIFLAGMRMRAVDRMELEADIRTGIEQGEFAVFYQSKVNLTSGEIIGFEALLRWNHPARGLIMPAEFIPIAEETGLIVPLGYWVLSSVCSQLREWQRLGASARLSVSVNISSRQFAEPDLVERISGILRESGISANTLDLELTETAVMRNPEAASTILRQIKGLGIGLEIDDFGTGYSSLSSLERFAFDTIKIDRSFIKGLGCRIESIGLVRTIIDLAKNFNMKLVAEGIETEVQLAELKALGCEVGQGYLFSVPVNATAAGEMIASSRRASAESPEEALSLA